MHKYSGCKWLFQGLNLHGNNSNSSTVICVKLMKPFSFLRVLLCDWCKGVVEFYSMQQECLWNKIKRQAYSSSLHTALSVLLTFTLRNSFPKQDTFSGLNDIFCCGLFVTAKDFIISPLASQMKNRAWILSSSEILPFCTCSSGRKLFWKHYFFIFSFIFRNPSKRLSGGFG